MDPVHRAVLRKHRLALSDQLLVSESIVHFLFQEEVLDLVHLEDINSRCTSRDRCLRLLDLLPGRGPRAFSAFLQALDQDYSWVRDLLLLDLQAAPGPGPGPGPSAPDPRIPDQVLLRVPSDRVLSRLASRLGPEGDSVLLDLGLSPEDLFRCRSDHSLSTRDQVLAGLVLWRRRGGRSSTNQRLQESLGAAGLHPSLLQEVLMMSSS